MKHEILMICGSLRAGSTNAAVLHTASELANEITSGTVASIYDGLAKLPYFNPDDDHDPLDPLVADLRHRIAVADAVLFSTPEYAGALPGSFKNLLDWTVGGIEICDKPVAWINASTSPTGAENAHDSLRKVLGYTGAHIVEAACVHIPIPRQAVGTDGLIHDPVLREEITAAVMALVNPPKTGGPVEAVPTELDVPSAFGFNRGTVLAHGDIISPNFDVMNKIHLTDKFAQITEAWQPRIAGELNGQQVKLAKFRGAFEWHHHKNEDELFLVIHGHFRMEFRDQSVELGEGDMLIVPRGVEHRPVADEEADVLLFEPASTLNTGNIVNERTISALDTI